MKNKKESFHDIAFEVCEKNTLPLRPSGLFNKIKNQIEEILKNIGEEKPSDKMIWISKDYSRSDLRQNLTEIKDTLNGKEKSNSCN